MTLKPILIAAGAILATAGAVSAASVTYDGVTFPAGDVSFADAVVSYTPGTNLSSSGACTDTSKALGAPNWVSGDCSEYVSLGNGGSLVLQFTDNALSASGDALADLHIFEIGTAVEQMDVAISTDNTTWIEVGTVRGQPSSIDIDAFAGVTTGVAYSFVRITDVLNDNFSNTAVYAGADIDAVGAIYSVDAPQVPLPATGLLLIGAVGGLGGWRRLRRG